MQKKFPPLSSLLARPKDKPAQSWQEQLAIAHMWTMRGVGTISKKVH